MQQAVSPQDVAEGGGGGVTWAGWVVDRVDSGGDGEELESPAVQSALLSTVEMRGGGLGVEMCRGGIVRVKWARGPPPPPVSPPRGKQVSRPWRLAGRPYLTWYCNAG